MDADGLRIAPIVKHDDACELRSLYILLNIYGGVNPFAGGIGLSTVFDLVRMIY